MHKTNVDLSSYTSGVECCGDLTLKILQS
jgi:hypothetical protein